MPQAINERPRYLGASGKYVPEAPDICRKRSKNWTIAKPKPISETAVLIQDIMVRSTLSLVLSQPKCVSAVTLTSNLLALVVTFGSTIGDAFSS